MQNYPGHPTSGYQARYRAYAQAHGRSPEELLAHDTTQYPGGKMAGYITWINQQWAEWDRLHARNCGGHAREWIRSDAEHIEFDTWLLSRYPKES